MGVKLGADRHDQVFSTSAFVFRRCRFHTSVWKLWSSNICVHPKTPLGTIEVVPEIRRPLRPFICPPIHFSLSVLALDVLDTGLLTSSLYKPKITLVHTMRAYAEAGQQIQSF